MYREDTGCCQWSMMAASGIVYSVWCMGGKGNNSWFVIQLCYICITIVLQMGDISNNCVTIVLQIWKQKKQLRKALDSI